jgi:hypothetical protein
VENAGDADGKRFIDERSVLRNDEIRPGAEAI